MKKKKEVKKEKKIKKPRKIEIYFVLLLISALFISVASASVTDVKLNITADVEAEVQDGLFISNVSLGETSGVEAEEIIYYKGTLLSSSIQLAKETGSYLTYNISLFNNSSNEYYFKGVTYEEENGYSNNKITYVLSGLKEYETTIAANKPYEFAIQFKYADGITAPTAAQTLTSLLDFAFSNEFIEFTLAETKYSAPVGATWEQFINSKYNTYGFKIENELIYTSEGKQLYLLSAPVKLTDVIEKDTVYNYKPELTLEQETIEIYYETGSTGKGTLTATLKNVTDIQNLKWTSSNTDIATVSGNGATAAITGKAAGFATITVSYVKEITATCNVNVKENHGLKLTDTNAGIASDYKIYGNSIQYGIPTPNAPVEVKSVGDKTKNLFSGEILTQLASGATIAQNDNEIEITATSTSGYNCVRAGFDINLYPQDTDLVLSYDANSTGTARQQIVLRVYGNNSVSGTALYNITTTKIGDNQYLFQIPSNIENATTFALIIYSNYGSGSTIGDSVTYKNIQIEKGTTATSYEPYGKYKIPVKVSGKNLFNPTYNFSGYNYDGIKIEYLKDEECFLLNGTASTTKSLGLRYINVPITKGKYFSLSTRYISGTVTRPTGTEYAVAYFGASDTIDSYNNWRSVNLLEDDNIKANIQCNYDYITSFWFFINQGVTFDNYKVKIQLEEGKTATEYEPYVEPQTVNIYLDEPLRKIGDYADYIDFEKKKVVRNAGNVDLSTLNWQEPSGYSGYMYYCPKIANMNYTNPDIPLGLCTGYKVNSKYGGWAIADTFEGLTINWNTGALGLKDMRYFKDTSGFKNALKNVLFYYALIEPTEETISLPGLPIFDNYTKIEVLTEIAPSNMEVSMPIPSITLDKTEINLEIESGGTATADLTATLKNISGDVTWEVSPEDSGITLSGEGNTRTITATKAVENATITVSNGTTSATCTVNVTKKASLITFTIDDGAEYNALEGMTWLEFVNSDYNVDGFVAKNTMIYTEQIGSTDGYIISTINKTGDYRGYISIYAPF